MQRFVRDLLLVAILTITSLISFAPSAEAVPSFARRYGFACSSCHTMWGALNPAGTTFKLSGYRAMFGKDLVPIEESKDIVIPGVNQKLPRDLGLSFVTGVGYENRTESRRGFDGTTEKRGASSLALEDASIFLTTPVGDHFSAFVEFPMYETRAWEFTPTGQSGPAADNNPGGANDTKTGLRHFQFGSEKPIFEVAKFFWNNLLGDSLPRDSVNALVGITHMPLPYSPGKVRLSVNQYPIYERRALELISPVHPSLMGTANDQFRLSEPQVLAEIYGMVVPGGNVTDSAKKETPWFEYHLGMTNGSNDATNNNRSLGTYGRLVGRYYGQSLGVFGFYKPDTYSDMTRMDSAFVIGCNGASAGGCAAINPTGAWSTTLGGVFNPLNPYAKNSASAIGIDSTLSLAPWGVPVSLDNQYMWRNESNPTGFDVGFSWHGGFHQLNWFVRPNLVAYGRYDWIRGNRFNDTLAGGITFSDPREWDAVFGLQYTVYENVKLMAEYRHHEFEDRATTASGGFVASAAQPFVTRTTTATLKDDGFTTRLMMGF